MSMSRVAFRVSGPLAELADGYARELARLGYAPVSVRLQLKVFAGLSEWLQTQGTAAANLRSSDLNRFLEDRRTAGHSRYASSKAVRPILDYLQRLEVVAKQIEDKAADQVEEMLGRFWRYLTVERALATATARAYLDMVRPSFGADWASTIWRSVSKA
jgi:site-specific recombinase XerD